MSPCDGFRTAHDGSKDKCRLWEGHPGTCDFGDPVLVAVSPEVARLIEAVGADNLPALLRVAYWGNSDNEDARIDAINDGPRYEVWEALGEALDGEA